VGTVLDVIDQSTRAEEDEDNSWTAPVRLAVVFAFLALLPSLLVMMTSFTRIVIVLGFIRRALSTQSIPPTVALIGLALFLTLFTMGPVFAEINEVAIQPYQAEEIEFSEAVERGNRQLLNFMLRQTRPSDLEMFVNMSGIAPPETPEELPMRVAVPAFAVSEFRTAFEIGCLLFIPFLLIDLVIGAILLSAGMMMLPPAMISLPFKIILFVLVDGWRLLAETLVLSFH
jgi:flagellar biosynthetic protein FliP